MAYSGDTEWTDSLMDLADRTELFILECNNYKTETPGHLSYRTILSKNHRLNTNRLILSHMSNDVLEREDLRFDRLEDNMEIKLASKSGSQLKENSTTRSCPKSTNIRSEMNRLLATL